MLGQLLDGRYKIIRVLGAGGFGQTFIAEDIKLDNAQPTPILYRLLGVYSMVAIAAICSTVWLVGFS